MAVPLQFIDLLCGWPNPALLPAPDLLRSATTVLTTPAISKPALQYGPDEGYEPLRDHVAHWLEVFYQPRAPISKLRICITGGASQNLACVFQVFTDPLYTRNVWMVDPTYHLAGRIIEDSGFDGRVRGVPEDDEGLDLRFLEAELQAAEDKASAEGNTEPKIKVPKPWRKIYKHVIYGVPTFANPSGKIMSVGHREKLVRLARKYDALLITDDVYDMLQWPATANADPTPTDRAVAPRLVDVDRYLDGGPVDEWGHAISNGSFSKLIGPGARTGWAEASEKVAYGISQVGSSRSGGAPSHLTAAVVDQLLVTGFLDTYIRDTLRPAYGTRYHKMMAAIDTYLVPRGVSVTKPPGPITGGYFIWIKLPRSVHAADVVERGLGEESLRLAPGTLFQVVDNQRGDPNRYSDRIRLCFAWAEPDELTEGVRRLGDLLGRMV